MWVIHTWPTVLHRVLEKKEPLRKVAEDDGVSHETIRRVVRAARCSSKAGVRTDLPRSQHRFHYPHQSIIHDLDFPSARASHGIELSLQQMGKQCGSISSSPSNPQNNLGIIRRESSC